MNPLPATGARKAALAFIFITVLIDVLAFGVIIPVLPHLVQQFVGGDTSTAAYWTGAFAFSFSLVQFFSAPIQGALSDRYGRRPVILVSCLGLGLDFIFMALAPNLAWLFVGRIISAATSASFTTANAYIADVTAPEARAKSFGMIGAAFGLGFIVGPLLGGVLGDIDHRLPFWFSACLALLNFGYGLFVLPESLPKEKRAPVFDWQHARPMGGVNMLRQYPQIWGLVAVVFVANFAHYVYPSTFVLFADASYGWKEKQAGYVLSVVGVLSVIVNVLLVGRLVKAFGERRAVMFGLACGTLGFLVYGLAGSGWMFMLGLPISALWAIAAPATQALITRQVPADAQGRIQGALSSLVSLAGIFAPAVFAGAFGFFIGPHAPVRLPGIAFLIAAVMLAFAAFVAWRYTDAAHLPPKPGPAPATR
ncbi:TCR/Tet family MFS transporter [Thermomonas sp.]|mgnify:FL=1|uniref:TCR/Tet family MFS transporter n=1 Tax=Thermomonas sp. TaxID=1971895 RepID=UPI001B473E72|nr:TCR/Tet family MFS transporter [Thermomonas sp.]MBK6415553.1 TCR/Tet family MFS transporter [Thermomonas sp.]MBK6925713.1 TCR/Tet family MFS transporter [Thermomonas sp.]MBL0228389.1 TCR/Tet family MFS transporter [Thermomonas sp.]MBP6439052.1 TCR/Tet family MFS transporter [Thermomonas sp.]MBP7158681.1 TCR/Tet family MFS transporter [Thermomonas sp.]